MLRVTYVNSSEKNLFRLVPRAALHLAMAVNKRKKKLQSFKWSAFFVGVIAT